MTEQQIPKLAGALVEHQKEFAKFSVEDGQWVIQNTIAAIGLFAEAVKNRQKAVKVKADPLLDFLGTAKLSATTERFIAREKFVVNTAEDASVKISDIGSNFEARFLDKVEEPMAETALRYGKLRRWSRDIPIINELGGEEKAETTLAAIYALMERQRNGKKGILLTNGYANIFYIRDRDGVLCAVGVRWYGDGWGVRARSVEYPCGWFDGYLVFSGNS